MISVEYRTVCGVISLFLSPSLSSVDLVVPTWRWLWTATCADPCCRCWASARHCYVTSRSLGQEQWMTSYKHFTISLKPAASPKPSTMPSRPACCLCVGEFYCHAYINLITSFLSEDFIYCRSVLHFFLEWWLYHWYFTTSTPDTSTDLLASLILCIYCISQETEAVLVAAPTAKSLHWRPTAVRKHQDATKGLRYYLKILLI